MRPCSRCASRPCVAQRGSTRTLGSTLATTAQVIESVRRAFSGIERPEHFGDYLHCNECAEHDELLCKRDLRTLELNDVNNPGWDPICYCSPQGKAYYMPALVAFALTDDSAFPYWQQLLFHLEGDGPNSALIAYCSADQRAAIANFLEHLIEVRSADIESFRSTDEALKALGYWSAV